MRDGAIRSLEEVDLVILNSLFAKERKPIEDFMKEILKHNYEMQNNISRWSDHSLVKMFDEK